MKLGVSVGMAPGIWVRVDVGEALADGEGEGVSVTVGENVGVASSVGLSEALALGVGVVVSLGTTLIEGLGIDAVGEGLFSGDRDALGVGLCERVGLADSVEVGVREWVGEGVGGTVPDGESVREALGSGEAVAEGRDVGLGLIVPDGLLVLLGVTLAVAVGVTVGRGVAVRSGVGVRDEVGECVGVYVLVTVGDGTVMRKRKAATKSAALSRPSWFASPSVQGAGSSKSNPSQAHFPWPSRGTSQSHASSLALAQHSHTNPAVATRRQERTRIGNRLTAHPRLPAVSE